jgi:hypothetical protein
MKRRRQARTESSVVPMRRATSLVPTPSAASNNALAWVTLRCGNDDERAITSSAARCWSVIGNGAAVTVNMLSP